VRGGREDESLLAGLSLSIPLYMRNDFNAEVSAANAKLIWVERTAHNAYQLARARLLTATARLRLTLHTWREWYNTGRASLREQLNLLQRL
jgi:outer membrane protein, heavy metal efflux system